MRHLFRLIVGLMLSASPAIAEWRVAATIQSDGSTDLNYYFGNITQYVDGKLLISSPSSQRMLQFEADPAGVWLKTGEIQTQVGGRLFSPDGRRALGGRFEFAVLGGSGYNLIDATSGLVEDIAYQEFGSTETDFKPRNSWSFLSNTNFVATSKPAGNVKGAVHIFSRGVAGYWVRAAEFQKPDSYFTDSENFGVAAGDSWAASFSQPAHVVELYKRTTGGWLLAQSVSLEGLKLLNIGMNDDHVVVSVEEEGSPASGLFILSRLGDQWIEDGFYQPLETGPSGRVQHAQVVGDTIVAGAPYSGGSGAVYIYTPDGTGGWTYEQIENPQGAINKAHFGERVLWISTDQIAVTGHNLTETDGRPDSPKGFVQVLERVPDDSPAAVTSALQPPTPISPSGPSKYYRYSSKDYGWFWLKWTQRYGATSYEVKHTFPERPGCGPRSIPAHAGTRTDSLVSDIYCGLGYCYQKVMYTRPRSCSTGAPYSFSWKVRVLEGPNVSDWSPEKVYQQQ